MKTYLLNFHTVKNEDLYFKDYEGNHYDKWAGFFRKEVQAESIEQALKKGVAIAPSNWRSVSYSEFTGLNERGQKCFKGHSVYNPKYEIE